ncbi:hypothetical protein HDU98_002889 [Podochytrium sp. JEL0797]|nr:hypothetical protein HDU98_002889 [Podochytrium sp. JEL0797]
MVRNHNFCNSLVTALKGVTTGSATASPAITNNQNSSPVPTQPGKRSSSLTTEPTPPSPVPALAQQSQPTTSAAMTSVTEFWKSVIDSAVTAAKALGVLVPIQEPPEAGVTATSTPAVAPTQSSTTTGKKLGKKKKSTATGTPSPNDTATGISAGTTNGATPAATSLPGVVAAAASGSLGFMQGLTRAGRESPTVGTNIKILGLAMLAVMFGLALTVLNIVWMAELSDRLERTLDAVRIARERNAAGGVSSSSSAAGPAATGKGVMLVALDPVPNEAVPVVVQESVEDIRIRLVDHSSHLLEMLPMAVGKSIDSAEGLRKKLDRLKSELVTSPVAEATKAAATSNVVVDEMGE